MMGSQEVFAPEASLHEPTSGIARSLTLY